MHKTCSKFKDEPGFYAPVFQVQMTNAEKICKRLGQRVDGSKARRLSFNDLGERGESDKAVPFSLKLFEGKHGQKHLKENDFS